MKSKPYHLIALIALICAFQLFLTSCSNRGSRDVNFDNASLNSLTKKQYNAFARQIYEEHKKNPQAVGEQAKQVIIGMAGLENRPESHGIFEVDVNFNANAMLLLVGNANKIKQDVEFIEEFKRQMKGTRPQLKTEDERTYFDVFTALLLSEQDKL